MTLTDLLVPTYRNMLGTLNGILGKTVAELGAEQAEALLTARLAPDMFPLATQLRFAAFQAQEGCLRLAGQPLPEALIALLNGGRNAGTSPGTIAEAKEHIDQALAFLDTLEPGALDQQSGDAPMCLDLPDGTTFDLTREQYARDWALGQFYFHVMAAYAILRKEGVEIGKVDYVPHMFAYLRPGTFPGA